MGISQSLLKATQHPKFNKVQYGADKQLTVIHYDNIQQKQIQFWRQSQQQSLSDTYSKIHKQRIDQKQYQDKYPSLLIVPEQNIKIIKDGFCSEEGKLLVKVMNVWETTLQEEIKQRTQVERHYTQEQIWFMLYKIAQTVVAIHEKNQISILGNLHPANILVSKQGQLLLISQYSLPKQKDHFSLYKQKGMQKSFISPQLVGFLQNKIYKEYPNYPSCINRQKCEAYSLGLTLLSVCCLQPSITPSYYQTTKINTNINYIKPQVSRQSSSRHNYQNLINIQYFNQKMHFIQTRYSRMLYMVVKGLLEDIPENRLSIVELWEVLLRDKKGYILGMDEEWYLQSLEPIQEYEGNQNQHENQQQHQQQRYFNYKDRENQQDQFYYINKKKQSQNTLQFDPSLHFDRSNDQRIQIWQRSLQKQQKFSYEFVQNQNNNCGGNNTYMYNNNNNVPKKISWTYGG